MVRSRPLISIITPTLNSEPLIRECLMSVADQTYGNIEHLVIDGGSTDATVNAVKQLQEQYSHISIISEADEGIYDAMNKGIKEAKGEWLYFLGSDDRLYDKNVLSALFERKWSKKVRILYGNVIINGDAGWARDGEVYAGEFNLHKLLEKNICHQAIFYKRIVFNRYGNFIIKYRISADWDLNLRLWSIYSFTYVNQIIAVFKGGQRSSRDEYSFDEFARWKNIVKYFKWKILDQEFADSSGQFLHMSDVYYRRHKYLKSSVLRTVYCFHKKRYSRTEA
jgi:glycosyltransferase involved in cell wall biosynthesis